MIIKVVLTMQINDMTDQISPSGSQCVVCKCRDASVATRKLKRSYVPSGAFLAVVLGPLIGLIVIAALTVKHEVALAFCSACWKRKHWTGFFQGVSVLLFLGSFVAGVALMLKLDNGWAFFVPIVFAGVLVGVAEYFKRSALPRFKVTDRQRVIVQTPEGDLEFAKGTVTTLRPA